LMNRLPFVIVLRMFDPVLPSESLRRFICLEAQIALFMLLRQIKLPQPAIREHKVIVCLQVLGIDRQNLLQFVHCVLILVLQEADPPDVIDYYAIFRVLLFDNSQMLNSLIILALGTKGLGIEIMCASEVWIESQRLLQSLLCAFDIAFLHQNAPHIYISISP